MSNERPIVDRLRDTMARLSDRLDGGVSELEQGYLASIVETVELQPNAEEISIVHSPLQVKKPDGSTFDPVTVHSIDLSNLTFGHKPSIPEIAAAVRARTTRNIVYDGRRPSEKIWDGAPPCDIYHFSVTVSGERKEVKYYTRRLAVKGIAAGLGILALGGIAAACGRIFRSPTPPSEPTPFFPPTPTILAPPTRPRVPEQINFSGVYIDANYLKSQGTTINNVLSKVSPGLAPLPTPVPVSSATSPVRSENAATALAEMIEYTKARWAKNELRLGTSQSNSSPPIDVLRLSVSNNTRNGINQGINWYSAGEKGDLAFANLNFYSEQLDFSSHPDWQGEYVIKKEGDWPQGLVLKKGSRITVVGRNVDAIGKESIVITYEEHEPREDGTKFHEPRIRFAVLTKETFGIISKELLLNMEYFEGQDRVIFTDRTLPAGSNKREVKLNTISDEVLSEIFKETKGLWAERYPNTLDESGRPKDFKLFPAPLVRYPDRTADKLPEGINLDNLTYKQNINYKYKGNTRAVTYWAFDKSNKKPVLIAHYDIQKKEWIWGELTLRDLCDYLGLEIGALGDWYKVDKYKDYARTLENEFNLAVCNWELNWFIDPNQPPLRPSKNIFDFTSRLDKYITWVESRQMKVQGQHLLDGTKGTLPSWLINGNFSRDEVLSLMEEHINKVVGRYTDNSSYGTVHQWSVINELYATPWTQSYWKEKLGEPNLSDPNNWVAKAFRWANIANPKARLILNDSGIEFPSNTRYDSGRAEKIYKVVKALKEMDVPIHAVGFQMHLVASDFLNSQGDLDRNLLAKRIQELKDNIQRFQSIKNSRGENLEVIITEADLDMIRAKEGAWPMNPPLNQQKRFEIQAEMYKSIYAACLDAGVKSFSFFGVTDEYSWAENPNAFGIGPDADPLLFDNYRPKPAYLAIRNSLQDRIAALV